MSVKTIRIFIGLTTNKPNIYEAYRARTTPYTPPILLRLYYARSYMYRCCDGILSKELQTINGLDFTPSSIKYEQEQ